MGIVRIPQTLVEGNAYVLVEIDENGNIVDVKYQGSDVRLFEKLWIGMPVDELPRVVPMICGVCSASHHVCSAKALDGVKGVEPPDLAKRIRSIINLGLHLNNQALHLFAIGIPSLLPEVKSVIAIARNRREFFSLGIKIASLGLKIVEVFGGKKIHPINAVAGGVLRIPSRKDVEETKKALIEAREEVSKFVSLAIESLMEFKELVDMYRLPVHLFIATHRDRRYEITYGETVVYSRSGEVLAKISRDEDLAERAVSYSYVKHVYFSDRSIATGALARMNLVESYGVAEADELRDQVKQEIGDTARSPLVYHFARAIEVLATYGKLLELLREPLDGDYLVKPVREGGEGIGIVEAPRGTLIHRYRADGEGRTVFINIVTPTAINAAAIEEALRVHLQNTRFDSEEVAKLVKTIVPCFDPCMSCSTHVIEVRRIE